VIGDVVVDGLDQIGSIPVYKNIQARTVQTLITSLTGGSVKDASLTLTSGGTQTAETSVEVTIEKQLTMKTLFETEFATSYKYSHSETIRSEFRQNVTANLRLVDPKVKDKNTVVHLEVTPYWYVPAAGALLDPRERPYWMPDDYVAKKIIPWCLTWRWSASRTGTGQRS
jgi:hypothetical protein